MMRHKLLTVFIGTFWVSTWVLAAPPPPTAVPPGADFVRSLESEAFLQGAGHTQTGVQGFRLESNYLDTDVNAFVGLITTLSHFNDHLNFITSDTSETGSLLWDWGANLGLIRGRHRWELDLMGSSLGGHIAFAPAFAGEHTLGAGWKIYHRTTVNLFLGFTLVDSDQGLVWYPTPDWGLSAGYRLLGGQHVTSQNGPRLGIVYRFESPKIPFIFPSLG